MVFDIDSGLNLELTFDLFHELMGHHKTRLEASEGQGLNDKRHVERRWLTWLTRDFHDERLYSFENLIEGRKSKNLCRNVGSISNFEGAHKFKGTFT